MIPGAVVRSCIHGRNWAKEESNMGVGGWLKSLNWLKPGNFLHKFISVCRWIANALQGLEVRWICEKGLFDDELSMFFLLFNMEISGNCMVANWSACSAWLMHQHNCTVHVGEWLLSGIDLSLCEEILQRVYRLFSFGLSHLPLISKWTAVIVMPWSLTNSKGWENLYVDLHVQSTRIWSQQEIQNKS